jgi:hypothetical protein
VHCAHGHGTASRRERERDEEDRHVSKYVKVENHRSRAAKSYTSPTRFTCKRVLIRVGPSVGILDRASNASGDGRSYTLLHCLHTESPTLTHLRLFPDTAVSVDLNVPTGRGLDQSLGSCTHCNAKDSCLYKLLEDCQHCVGQVADLQLSTPRGMSSPMLEISETVLFMHEDMQRE